MASVKVVPASSLFDSLPVEVLDDILCRLPWQDLFSARDVCSRWRAVIANNTIMQNRLYLTPQPSRYHGKYMIYGDPEDECRIELRLYRQRLGGPAPSSFIRYYDTFAIRTFPVGHMNESFLDTGYERRIPNGDSTFPVSFSRDPRQVFGDDLYMGAWQSVFITRPPQTSMQFVMAFHDAQLVPEDSSTRQRLVAADYAYASHALNGVLYSGIIRRVELWNPNGIRVGDIIGEIDQAETEIGGHFDPRVSGLEFPDLKCLSGEDLRNVVYAHPPGSVDDLGNLVDSSETNESP